MSIWQDSPEQSAPDAGCADVVFRITCTQLPVDHAKDLAASLLQVAPWIEDIPNIGIHTVHVAGSQNGWERPNPLAGERLMLSKRTRLRIRVPIAESGKLIDSLSNQQLSIDGEPLAIMSGTVRHFTASTTLFTRSCCFADVAAGEMDESEFTDHVVRHCEQSGFSPNKILCGKSLSIQTTNGPINCRSVMIADVPTRISVKLQDAGIGGWRLFGCGILLPHKDTAAVG